jgi:CheY-like chemotaxis protein
MRVVFCDDQSIIRKLIELSLRGTSYEFRIAADGSEALDILRQWRPDALITDVAMPGMDGLQLAAAVRADPGLRDLRIVFMTASIQRDVIVNEIAVHGPTAHLRKPFGPAAMRTLLASLERGG